MPAGGLQAYPVDIAPRCHAHLVTERAGEVPRGEARALREGVDGEVRRRVLGDPLLYVAQRPALCGLRGELGAELGLVARTPQKDDQMPGDGQREVPAEVLLHQGQREVDTGRHARGGGQVAVPYVDRLGFHVHRGEPLGEGAAEHPVGRRAAAVQQPGLGQQQRSAAHRDLPPGAVRVAAQPVDQPGVGGTGALTAGHQQGVRSPDGVEREVGDERQSAGGADRGTVETGGADPVGARYPLGRPVEDVDRSADVEGLHTVEENDEHIALFHTVHPGQQHRWRQ